MRKTIDMMTIGELEEKIKKYNNLTFVVKVDDEELLEEYKILKEKLKEIKRISEDRYDLLIKATNELINKDMELEKLKKENKKLKNENLEKEIKECKINIKDCLDSIELFKNI